MTIRVVFRFGISFSTFACQLVIRAKSVLDQNCVMATVRYFWHGYIQRGATFMYFQYSRPTLFINFPNVWKAPYTISASIFVGVPYLPPYNVKKIISTVVSDTSWWLFHFGQEIIIAWTHIGWVRWMFQNLPLLVAQEIRDSSSGVTTCIVMKNDRVL